MGWGGTPHLHSLLSPMSARWEEEYTVRIQLQERVNELQEVRAAHHCAPSTLPPPHPAPSNLPDPVLPWPFLVFTYILHRQHH